MIWCLINKFISTLQNHNNRQVAKLAVKDAVGIKPNTVKSATEHSILKKKKNIFNYFFLSLKILCFSSLLRAIYTSKIDLVQALAYL